MRFRAGLLAGYLMLGIGGCTKQPNNPVPSNADNGMNAKRPGSQTTSKHPPDAIILKSEVYPYSVAFSPDGKLIATGDELLQIWDVSKTRPINTLEPMVLVGFLQSGHLLAAATDGMLHRWDLKTATETPELSGGSPAAISPNGQFVACLGSELHSRTITVWDLNDERPLRSFTVPSSTHAITFTGNGRLIGCAGFNQTLQMFDFEGKPCWQARPGQGRSIAASADGSLIAVSISTVPANSSSGKDELFEAFGSRAVTPLNETHVFDCETGELRWTLNERDRLGATALAFSPTSLVMAAGNGHGSIRLYDLSNGELIDELYGHEHNIPSLTFSPDGRRLASVSDDYTLRIWDVSELLSDYDNGKRSRDPAPIDWQLLREQQQRVIDKIKALGGRVKVLDGGPKQPIIAHQIDVALPDHVDEMVNLATNLTTLKRFHVPRNSLTDAGLANIRKLEELTHLQLSGPQISDRSIELVVGLERIETLGLHDTSVTDDGLKRIATSFPRLAVLTVRNTAITDEALESLASLPELQLLDLINTSITDDGLRTIAKLEKITHLTVSDMPITDAGLAHLESLKQLENLDLSNTLVTDQGIERLRKSLPDCFFYRHEKPSDSPR